MYQHQHIFTWLLYILFIFFSFSYRHFFLNSFTGFVFFLYWPFRWWWGVGYPVCIILASDAAVVAVVFVDLPAGCVAFFRAASCLGLLGNVSRWLRQPFNMPKSHLRRLNMVVCQLGYHNHYKWKKRDSFWLWSEAT